MTMTNCLQCGESAAFNKHRTWWCSGRCLRKWRSRACEAMKGIHDPLAEMARLREIERAARRYILLEGFLETDIDVMYAAWDKIKAALGLSDLTPRASRRGTAEDGGPDMPHVMISGEVAGAHFTVRVPYKNGEPLWDEITNEDGSRPSGPVRDLINTSYGYGAIKTEITKQEGKE